jgi:uncharacterized coiled-coil protein SlyX
MSMKLDENSFNLKEEAEIKGGGFGIGENLPWGVSEITGNEVNKIKRDLNIQAEDVHLLKISKSITMTRSGIQDSDTFKKFNSLFDKEEKGKRLHFLKASFFKTDEKTIYTYSEHRTPMELVEDFPEYYKNVFERDIVLEVNSMLSDKSNNINSNIKRFVTIINIIYLLCKKIKDYLEEKERSEEIIALNKKEVSFVTYIIDLFEKNVNDSQKLKDIFITKFYTGDSIDLKDIKNGKKIDDKDIFDIISLSKTKNISLKIIINKLYVLSNYLNKIIKEDSTINIFKPELYHKRSGKDLNYNNYTYLYDAIRNNLENLKEQPQKEEDFDKDFTKIEDKSEKSVIGNNLQVLTYTIIDVLTNFNESITSLNNTIYSILTNNILIIDKVLMDLQSKIDKVKTDNKYKTESEIEEDVNTKIQELTDSATTDETTFKDTKTKEQVIIGFKGQIEQLKSVFYKKFKEFKNIYDTKKAESQSQKDYIMSIIGKAQQLSDGSAIIEKKQYNNITKDLESLTAKFDDYEELVGQINAEVAKASQLIDETRQNLNFLNSKLEREGESVIESFVDTIEPLLEIKVSDEIAGYKTTQSNLFASIKDKYDTYITKQIEGRKAATTIQSAIRRTKLNAKYANYRNEPEYGEPDYGGGGKSNIKELRKKLNTMSIKQLKRLSTKNNIEYGNINTIKSLINNYIKHIKFN